MDGKALVAALEREGFVIKRRAAGYVWLSRKGQTLMLDEGAEVPEEVAMRVLDEVRSSG